MSTGETTTMPIFVHKPTQVEARRMNVSGTMDTPQGMISWDAGDWLIHGVGDVHYTVKHDVFSESYDPADNTAASYLDRVTRR